MSKLPRGIRQRGESFLVDVTHAGKRRTATCATLEEAVATQAQIKAEMLNPALAHALQTKATRDNPVWTLGQAYDYTKEHGWKGKAILRVAKINMQTHVLPYFNRDVLLDQIDTLALDDFKVSLMDKGLSNGTINRIMSALSKCMTVAMERGRLKAKPKFPRLKEGTGRIRTLSAKEEAQCIQYLKKWCLEPQLDVFLTLLDTGMRPSELWRSTISDVDLDANVIAIWENKTSNPRVVGMTPRVREVMIRRINENPVSEDNPKGYLFPGCNGYWFLRTWNRMKVALGLENDEQFIPYCLRHTCCTRIAQDEENNALKVATWMGHKSLQMTRRYTHFAAKDMSKMAERLARVTAQ